MFNKRFNTSNFGNNESDYREQILLFQFAEKKFIPKAKAAKFIAVVAAGSVSWSLNEGIGVYSNQSNKRVSNRLHVPPDPFENCSLCSNRSPFLSQLNSMQPNQPIHLF